jgi:hypothetical protein
MWAQRADSTAWLDWAHAVGQFAARRVFIIVFTILVQFFLYQEGASLARDFRRMLRHAVGERAEQYIEHTDLHAAEGDWPVKPALPFIPPVDRRHSQGSGRSDRLRSGGQSQGGRRKGAPRGHQHGVRGPEAGHDQRSHRAGPHLD